MTSDEHNTLACMIGDCWFAVMRAARNAGTVGPEIVEDLIAHSRKLLRDSGADASSTDLVLFEIYTAIHWDWDQPTDRIFETMLDFNLQPFFRTQGTADATIH
jgi:hypothetical protein